MEYILPMTLAAAAAAANFQCGSMVVALGHWHHSICDHSLGRNNGGEANTK